MVKVSILFFATGLLVLGFAFFVASPTAVVSIELFDRVFTHSTQQLFKLLSVLALVFAVLYRYTEALLFSTRWSVMHWICLVCLLINVWTLGVLERVLIPQVSDPTLGSIERLARQERFEKIQRFYSGSLLLLTCMQLSYIPNLLIGIFRRNSRF